MLFPVYGEKNSLLLVMQGVYRQRIAAFALASLFLDFLAFGIPFCFFNIQGFSKFLFIELGISLLSAGISFSKVDF